MTANRLEHGLTAEAAAQELLESRGWCTLQYRTGSNGHGRLYEGPGRSLPDLRVWHPGQRPERGAMVDIKSRLRVDGGKDMAMEIAPLLLYIGGYFGAVWIMYGNQWCSASRVFDAVLPAERDGSVGCCRAHHAQAVACSPERPKEALAVALALPAYCPSARRSEDASGTPYVWVEPSCMHDVGPG